MRDSGPFWWDANSGIEWYMRGRARSVLAPSPPPLAAAGCWLLAAGCWLLAAGCWLLAAGCWLLAAGCWLLAAGCWLLVASSSSPRLAAAAPPSPAPITTASCASDMRRIHSTSYALVVCIPRHQAGIVQSKGTHTVRQHLLNPIKKGVRVVYYIFFLYSGSSKAASSSYYYRKSL